MSDERAVREADLLAEVNRLRHALADAITVFDVGQEGSTRFHWQYGDLIARAFAEPFAGNPSATMLATPARDAAPVAAGERASVTHEQMAAAMQEAWDEFARDTGCRPDCFWTKGRQHWADFSRGNFARMAADALNAALAPPSPGAEGEA